MSDTILTETAPTAGDAFDEAMASAFGESAPVEPAVEPTPAPEADPADELAIEPAPVEPAEPVTTDPADPVEAELPADGIPVEPAADGTPVPAVPGVNLTDDQFRQLLAQVPAATQQPAQAPTPAPVEQPPVTLDSFLSDDEKALLAKYDDEWSDVAKAESIRRRAEMQYQTHQIYTEVAKALAPLTEVLREVKVKTHFDTIRQAHPDLEQVLPGVQAWVDQQPASLQGVFSQVLKAGTAEQVVDLVAAYKKTVPPGAAPVAPAPPVTPSAPPLAATPASRQAPRPTPTAAAVAATAAVEMGKRTAIAPGADPNDFSGAFAEALGG